MKRKKDSVSPPSSLFSGLKDETRHWILSVVSFSIALFFVLIAFDKAGIVGTYAHKILASLFGIGYLLFPLIFFIGGIVFLKEERPFFLNVSRIHAHSVGHGPVISRYNPNLDYNTARVGATLSDPQWRKS